MHEDLEPYIIVEDGKTSGFLALYLEEIFKTAKVTPIWERVPWARQFPTLKRNLPNVCAVGVYKTKERAEYSLYTDAIGSDDGYSLVGRAAEAQLTEHTKFADVVADNTFKPALQKNSVYSDYINSVLAGKGITYTMGSNLRLMRLVLAGDKDYVIMPKYMAQGLLKLHNLTKSLSIYDHYTDLEGHSPYYLACSKNTNPDTFNRINAEITRRGIARPN